MGEIGVGHILLLFAWAFGLARTEIEIEGGHGWAERLPTWCTVRRFGRGRVRWFAVPWLWRFPLDSYTGRAVSVEDEVPARPRSPR